MSAMTADGRLLEIEDLSRRVPDRSGGVMHAVDGVSLTLDEGEVLGIVGESGSGKSVTMLALMGLVAYPGPRARRARCASTATTCCASAEPRAPRSWSARTSR